MAAPEVGVVVDPVERIDGSVSAAAQVSAGSERSGSGTLLDSTTGKNAPEHWGAI